MNNQENYESVIRAMIEHENELMNHRVTWLSAIHGLLFTALGFAWGKAGAGSLIVLFGILGVFVSVAFFTVLRSASRAVSGLADRWEEMKPAEYAGPGVIGWRTTEKWQKVFYPWNLLPVLFGFTWLCVLVVHLSRCA